VCKLDSCGDGVTLSALVIVSSRDTDRTFEPPKKTIGEREELHAFSGSAPGLHAPLFCLIRLMAISECAETLRLLPLMALVELLGTLCEGIASGARL
jgi:hypothetical protein